MVARHTSNNLISALDPLAMAGEQVTDVGHQQIDKLMSEWSVNWQSGECLCEVSSFSF